jgi:hypothetical protein
MNASLSGSDFDEVVVIAKVVTSRRKMRAFEEWKREQDKRAIEIQQASMGAVTAKNIRAAWDAGFPLCGPWWWTDIDCGQPNRPR